VVTTTIRYGRDYHQQILLRRGLRQQSSFNFNPFSTTSQQRRLTNQSLRFLSLGGPCTRGQGLSNILDAYPFQLAKQHNHNVHNYALSEPTPRPTTTTTTTTTSSSSLSKQEQIMASLCTQSIIGDNNMYDVITLEYETIDYASLSLLTHRLRERFPRAIVIYIRLGSPLDMYFVENGQEVSFLEWRIQQQQQAPLNNEWSDKVSMMQSLQQYQWYLREHTEEGAELERILQTVDGVVYRLLTPSSVRDNLDVVLAWFEEDSTAANGSNDNNVNNHRNTSSLRYTLSPTAHARVAQDLEVVVRNELRQLYEGQAVSTSPSYSPVVGTWGSGDSCQLWYETGKGLSQQHYSRGLQQREFSNRYALEVAAPTGGTLQVHNPFEEDRVVYLTYMTCSANASSRKVYPRTMVRLQGDHSHVILDPSHDDNRDISHRTRTSAVGLVPAGTTMSLEFMPLEEYTLNKFRIVGLSFLAKEKDTYNIPSEFVLLSSDGLIVDDEEEDGPYAKYHHNSYTFSLRWWSNRGKSRNNNKRKTSLVDSASSSTSDDRPQ
jgi:hypothetical protein